MLKRLLHKVLRKSRPERERYAFASTVLVTSLIALVWFWQLPGKLQFDTTEQMAAVAVNEQTNAPPFSGIWRRASAFLRGEVSVESPNIPVVESAPYPAGTTPPRPQPAVSPSEQTAAGESPSTTTVEQPPDPTVETGTINSLRARLEEARSQ